MSQWRRAELYSTDSQGKPVKAVDRHLIGYTVMPVRETKPHALSRPTDSRDEETERAGEVAAKLDLLDPQERAVLELQARRWMEPREMQVEAADMARLLDEGWTLVRMGPLDRQVSSDETWPLLDAGWVIVGQEGGLTMMRLENGLATVAGEFAVHLTYEEIGERLGLSAHQVHRRVKSAHRKLRSKR